MPQTLHDRYVAAFKARGWLEAKADPRYQHQRRMTYSTKYTVLTHPDKLETKLFLGKSGAVRYGRTVTQSVAMSAARKAAILAAPISTAS